MLPRHALSFDPLEAETGIFDYNGTLINDRHVHEGSAFAVFDAHSIVRPSVDILRSSVMKNINAMFTWFYAHGIPRSVTPQEIRAIRDAYFEEHRNTETVMEGAQETLEYWLNRNKKSVIVSGARREHILWGLRKFRLEHYFSEIVSDSWGKKKEALLRVLQTFGQKPRNAFYLDDTYDGLAAAVAANIPSYGITQASYHTELLMGKANPNGMVSSFKEFLDVLRGKISARNPD